MAEDVCVSKTCGKAYDHTSKNLPFTIDYDKIRSGDSTTFSFKVRCNETAHSRWADLQCQPHHLHVSAVLPLGIPFTLSIVSRHAGRTEPSQEYEASQQHFVCKRVTGSEIY